MKRTRTAMAIRGRTALRRGRLREDVVTMGIGEWKTEKPRRLPRLFGVRFQ